MSTIVKQFDDATIEPLARLLGDISVGWKITIALREAHMDYEDDESRSKWTRLDIAFRKSQQDFPFADEILMCVQKLLAPVNFANDPTTFQDYRKKLNNILVFEGLEYQSNGQFKEISSVNTIAEPEASTNPVQDFERLGLPPGLMAYCESELRQGNYFHAIFEASKGLETLISGRAGVTGKTGTGLVGDVFKGKRSILLLNSLQNATEESEQDGLGSLLRGFFQFVRNPLAHDPKVQRDITKEDAIPLLILAGLLYRKVGDCRRVEDSQVEQT